MARLGIPVKKAGFFLPPYEWYNDSIAAWTRELQLQLISFTPGTRSTADYTMDADKAYRSNEEIWQSILRFEEGSPSGLNGFILLLHVGAGPGRTQKFFHRLPGLIRHLQSKGYQFQRVDEMLKVD